MPSAGIRPSLRSASKSAPAAAPRRSTRPHVHCAQAAQRARRQRRSGDHAAAHQARQDPGHHALHAGRRRTSPSAGGCPRPSINIRWTMPTRASSIIGRRSFSTSSERIPGITDVTTDQENAGPLLDITINREVASSFGILPSTIDNTLDDAFGQRIVSTMYTTLNQYHVVLEVDPRFQYGPEALNSIYVTSSSGQQVPLGHAGQQRHQECRRSSSTIRACSRR